MFETKQHRRMLAIAACAGTMLFLAGCASAPSAPSAALTEAKMAIQSAEKNEARQYAGAELDEARQKLIQADQAVVAEDMVLADRYAQESIITANLAVARAEASKAETINEEMRQSAKALAEEMRRAGDQQ